MLGNFSCFLLLVDFLSKLTFSKRSFRNIVRVSSSFDTVQATHSIGPDLGLNCLQRLLTTKVSDSREGVIYQRERLDEVTLITTF